MLVVMDLWLLEEGTLVSIVSIGMTMKASNLLELIFFGCRSSQKWPLEIAGGAVVVGMVGVKGILLVLKRIRAVVVVVIVARLEEGFLERWLVGLRPVCIIRKRRLLVVVRTLSSSKSLLLFTMQCKRYSFG